MKAVNRRDALAANLTSSPHKHVLRWKAMSHLRRCLTPLIQAAFRAGKTREPTADKEIDRLRQEIVDCTYIVEYDG